MPSIEYEFNPKDYISVNVNILDKIMMKHTKKTTKNIEHRHNWQNKLE